MGRFVRLLQPGDEEEIDVFLKPHTPFAYYMRSNAKYGGLYYEGKPYQAEFFGSFSQGKLIGILAHTWIASVQVFTTQTEAIPELAAAWQQHLAQNPRAIECFIGPSGQVEKVEQAAGVLPDALRGGGTEERLYVMPLEKLSFSAVANREGVQVRRAKSHDIGQLAAWRHDFNVEAKGDASGKENYGKAYEEISRRVGEGDLFVLEKWGELVSFCGAGGFLPDWKIVGPVWTPPDKRALGYGRSVTAGALLILREEGAANAVLFAQDPYAERAYRSIGFEVIGGWRLDFLVNPAARL